MSYITGKKVHRCKLGNFVIVVNDYRAKIKNFRNAIFFYIPFDPIFYTDHFLRKNDKLKLTDKIHLQKAALNDHF